MTEFEKTLKEYRQLIEQISDESGFLEFLRDQLRVVETKLKDIATAGTVQSEIVYTVGPQAVSADPDDSLPALQAAVRAVEDLGDGVTADQLSKHLNISRDAARLRLQRAARVGLIARMGIGRYRAIKRAPAPETTNGRLLNGIAHHQPEKIDGPGGQPA